MSDFSNYQDLLKGDELPIHGMRIIQFFDSNGTLHYRMKQDGSMQAANVLGVLDLIHDDLSFRARNSGKIPPNATS